MTVKDGKKNYKDTLNLPRTSFSMKAELPKREPEMLKKWEESDIYGTIVRKRKGSDRKFILHDGPPYANGHIHMGHVLNKILKDICVKYFTMKGYFSPYVPGWDCHGLPVEHQLFKELKITKHDIDQVKFRKKAHDYAMKYVGIQSDEFKRLGVFGDWKNPYLTLTKDYEAGILHSLADLCEKGYVYKGLKPVNWCSECETALAEAEVEYEDKVSPSVFVKFKADIKSGDTYFIIWTTTPWTLLANVAVAVHPAERYAFVSAGKETWIAASQLVQGVMKKAGVSDYTLSGEIKGSELAEKIKKARHPFLERDSVIVLADYVTMDEGTGCVHIAPGHGQEDYITGQKYSLPVIMPVLANGKFSGDAGEFAGLNVYDANKVIIEKMRSLGVLVRSEEMKHSYPHCWRCKKPIIFRATEQWFLNVGHLGLREKIINGIKNVEWIPKAGMERIMAMVETRPDWCLSRQRYWGVPIPAFRCVSCGQTFTEHSLIRKVAVLTREYGADVWFEKGIESFIDAGMTCRHCGKAEFKKEDDILDVWFDSGVSHRAVLDAREELGSPCDLYLEGSDQHRGWFQAAIITSMAMRGRAPYLKVLTHGFVVDGEGKKMSKSVGNVISPEDIMRKYGADVLRLWVASSDYEGDIKLSPEILERLADGYRKIRNTFRFLLSNLYDFEYPKNAVSLENLSETDRWMLSRLYSLTKDLTADYDHWEFYKVYREIYNFCVYEVSAFYLDVIKDVLYVSAADSRRRRSAQTVVFKLFNTLTRLLAPILSFTSEEAWGSISFEGKEESIHLSDWPDIATELAPWRDEDLDLRWKEILAIRDRVMKFLENKREKGIIGSSLEAALEFYPEDKERRGRLEKNIVLFQDLFKVSQAYIVDSMKDGMEDLTGLSLKVLVRKADGEKCLRCWNFSKTVGSNKDFPELCERCYSITSERSRNGQ